MEIDRPVVIGRIGAPLGIRGWVHVQSSARPPESILEFSRWLLWLDGAWRPRDLADFRLQPRGIAVRLDACSDRDQAAALRHADIAVERAWLPASEAGEWYWADLVGLKVENVAGVEFGVVDHLLATGANDVLVVRGDRERLVPWIPERVIREVDPDEGRILVDWDADF